MAGLDQLILSTMSFCERAELTEREKDVLAHAWAFINISTVNKPFNYILPEYCFYYVNSPPPFVTLYLNTQEDRERYLHNPAKSYIYITIHILRAP